MYIFQYDVSALTSVWRIRILEGVNQKLAKYNLDTKNEEKIRITGVKNLEKFELSKSNKNICVNRSITRIDIENRKEW